ncbi:unnamed protein product [Rangifer tarandus platyrhynchus]|uniref:Uncharacterized protein n=2 Tax=Rangifer tarandus platyrhynchus TaxID=3082113 RepID=A0ACB0EIT1_RANTA|nr:unnamed protein product [Rangifer tarandus platyrhynchus]CAI9700582.1 unnamed protein product [Rangifer tarandus platyrhynchus]
MAATFRDPDSAAPDWPRHARSPRDPLSNVAVGRSPQRRGGATLAPPKPLVLLSDWTAYPHLTPTPSSPALQTGSWADALPARVRPVRRLPWRLVSRAGVARMASVSGQGATRRSEAQGQRAGGRGRPQAECDGGASKAHRSCARNGATRLVRGSGPAPSTVCTSLPFYRLPPIKRASGSFRATG